MSNSVESKEDRPKNDDREINQEDDSVKLLVEGIHNLEVKVPLIGGTAQNNQSSQTSNEEIGRKESENDEVQSLTSNSDSDNTIIEPHQDVTSSRDAISSKIN